MLFSPLDANNLSTKIYDLYEPLPLTDIRYDWIMFTYILIKLLTRALISTPI